MRLISLAVLVPFILVSIEELRKQDLLRVDDDRGTKGPVTTSAG